MTLLYEGRPKFRILRMFTQTRHNCKLTWVKYQISQQSSGPGNFPQSCVECSGPYLCFYLQPLERKQQRAFSFFFRYFKRQEETVNSGNYFSNENVHFQIAWVQQPLWLEKKIKIVKADNRHVWKTRIMEMDNHLLFCSHPSQATPTPGNLNPLAQSRGLMHQSNHCCLSKMKSDPWWPLIWQSLKIEAHLDTRPGRRPRSPVCTCTRTRLGGCSTPRCRRTCQPARGWCTRQYLK